MKRKVKFKNWDCILNVGSYGDGKIALYLTEEGTGESVATCTVNLVDAPLGKNEVYIKEWSENEGMTDALINAEVIKPLYTMYPVGPYGAKASLCELNFKPLITNP